MSQAEPAPPPPEALARLVRDRLAETAAPLTPHAVARALRDTGEVTTDAMVLALHDLLRRDVEGLGPLAPLLLDPGTTDVLVNGCDHVFVDRGRGLERAAVRFASDAEVRRLAVRLAASAGRRLDEAAPFCDLRLPDGTRFHAVLAPLSRPGTTISLRVPARRRFDLPSLADAGMVSDVGVALLRDVVRSRCSFLVSGGTGSGKTTLLGALLAEVPSTERLVVVEDSSELRPDHPHVVGLEARPANVEGAGEITLRTLVRQALRMRPDRLIVGEVRGPEVTDLLTALNTGHDGGCGTIHANGVVDVPARLEALAAGAGWSRESVHSAVASALDLVVHLRRDRAGHRRLAGLGVLGIDPAGPAGRAGVVGVTPALVVDQDGTEREGPGADALSRLLRGRS